MESLSPEETLNQVELLLDRNRIREARSALGTALASHPDHGGLLLKAAWTDFMDDREDDALSTVKRVLTLEPDEPSARLLYFELLLRKDEHSEAEHVILGLLREYPEYGHYYGRYASLMLNTLNLAKARQLALEGLRYEAENDECLVSLTTCDLIEQRAGAPSHGLKQLLVRHPESIRTLLFVVIALEQRGDLKGAERLSKELVQANPANEHLVALARELRVKAHWSMLPMWPMLRFGWGGAVGVWLAAVTGLRVLAASHPALAAPLTVLFLVYVVYTWTWPAILRRLIGT